MRCARCVTNWVLLSGCHRLGHHLASAEFGNSYMARRALPFVLSVIAGSTDIIGFLGLNGLFTAHITGNIVVLAAHIVAGDPTIFSSVLSVPVFMMMLLLTRLLAG